MVVDGAHRSAQALGDLRVAQAGAQQRQHLALALGELVRVGLRRRAGAAWHAAHAVGTQPPAHQVGGGPGAQVVQQRQRGQARGLVALGQRERLLERRAERGPRIGCATPARRSHSASSPANHGWRWASASTSVSSSVWRAPDPPQRACSRPSATSAITRLVVGEVACATMSRAC